MVIGSHLFQVEVVLGVQNGPILPPDMLPVTRLLLFIVVGGGCRVHAHTGWGEAASGTAWCVAGRIHTRLCGCALCIQSVHARYEYVGHRARGSQVRLFACLLSWRTTNSDSSAVYCWLSWQTRHFQQSRLAILSLTNNVALPVLQMQQRVRG